MLVRASVVALLILFVASPALARNDTLDFTVDGAMSVGPKQNLLDIPWFMSGQKHPGVAERMQLQKSQKATNKFGKEDDYACSIAFMSAIIQLQKRAKQLGANAIVDIKSVTRGSDLDSATKYKCNLGTFTATVGLTGVPVKLK